MAPPPPRPPGMGYQQHRLSQGHLPHDHRSLTLPPLQTSGNVGDRNSIAGPSSSSIGGVGADGMMTASAAAVAAAIRRSISGNRDPLSSASAAASSSTKVVEDVIRGMDFRYKIGILAKVAPPAGFPLPSASAKKDGEGNDKDGSAARGPLIAIEGDDADAVRELGRWLSRELGKKGGGGAAAEEEDLEVRLVEGPLDEGREWGEGGEIGGKKTKKAIIEYHLLITEWLAKSDEIVESLRYRRAMPASTATAAPGVAAEEGGENADETMTEDLPAVQEKAKSERKLEEDYDDSEGSASRDEDLTSHSAQNPANKTQDPSGEETTTSTSSPPPPAKPSHDEDGEGETMQIDPPLPPPTSSSSPANQTHNTSKPVILLPNFSLHTSTAFALRIPIDPTSQYSAPDHWQWAATQWRGVVGPDLTIYVRDSSSGGSASGIGGENGGTASAGSRGRVVGGNGGVEMGEEGNLFVVRRTVGGGGGGKKSGGEVEGSVLRRLGFEVGEWVRAFGGSGEGEEGK